MSYPGKLNLGFSQPVANEVSEISSVDDLFKVHSRGVGSDLLTPCRLDFFIDFEHKTILVGVNDSMRDVVDYLLLCFKLRYARKN